MLEYPTLPTSFVYATELKRLRRATKIDPMEALRYE